MSSQNKNPLPRWTIFPVYITGFILSLAITIASVYSVVLLASERARRTTDFDEHGEWMMIAILYAGMLFLAAVMIRHSRLRTLVAPAMFFTMACCITAGWLWLKMYTNTAYWDTRTSDLIGFSIGGLTLIVLTLLHNGAFSCLYIRSGVLRIAVIVLVATTWVTTLPVVGGFLWYIAFESERPLVIIAPFASLLSLMVLIVSGLLPGLIRQNNRKWEAARDSISQKSTLSLECPRCNTPQHLRTGPAKCSSCSLLMNIELEEPRCECGYLLYKLVGTTCPECGRDLSDKLVSQENTESAEREHEVAGER